MIAAVTERVGIVLHPDAASLAGAVELVMGARLRALYAERRWPVVG